VELSAAADFVLKRSGDFPRLRISSESVHEAFRACGFHPGVFMKLSAPADSVLKRFWSFPRLRISS
jgi:hypothetical protein